MTRNLTPKQEAALNTEQHIFVEAGAGSGKTTILVQRYITLLKRHPNLDPSHVLAITFTQKAAGEMLARIQQAIATDPDFSESTQQRLLSKLRFSAISTIHGLCSSLLKQFPLESGVDPLFRILDKEQHTLIWLSAMRLGLAKHQDNPNTHAFLMRYSTAQLKRFLTTCFQHRETILPLLKSYNTLVPTAFIKNIFVDDLELQPKETLAATIALQHTKTLCKLFTSCLSAYNTLKETDRYLDYTDLLLKTQRLLSRYKHVRNALHQHYPFIMVDEFQDTDPIQWDILTSLCPSMTSLLETQTEQPSLLVPSTQHLNNLFIVGDIKQSIYAFRGADAPLFTTIMSQFKKTPHLSQVVKLNDNFRTQNPLLDTINQLFNQVFKAHTETPIPYTPLVSQRPETEGSIHMAILPKTTTSTPLSEGQFIAKWVLRELANNPTLTCSDIAILCRRKKNMTIFQHALHQAGLASTIYAKDGFYQNQEIVDCINLIRGLLIPHHNLAWIGVLKSPFFGLSDNGIYLLTNYTKGPSIQLRLEQAQHCWETISSSFEPPDRALLEEAFRLIPDWIHLSHYSPISDLLPRLINETGAWALYKQQPNGLQKVHHIQLFLDKLVDLEKHQRTTGLDLLDLLDHFISSAAPEPQGLEAPHHPDSIGIMSIHASKGLEFPVVIVPECHKTFNLSNSDPLIIDRNGIGLSYKHQGIDNPYRSFLLRQQRDRIIDEEKRIFYVACTRAKDALLLSGVLPDDHQPPSPPKHYFDLILDQGQILNKIYRLQAQPDVTIPVLHDINAPSQPLSKAVTPERSLSLPPPPETPALSMTGLLRLSTSELVRYLRCPKQYAYRYLIATLKPVVSAPSSDSPSNSFGMDASQYGTLMHRAIELINSDDLSPEDTVQTLLDQHALLHTPKKTLKPHLLEQLTRYINSDLYAQIASSDCEHEMPFSLRIDTLIIDGRLDTLMKGDDHWTVIDYKTDHCTSDTLDSHSERYKRQLMVYLLAARQYSGPQSAYKAILYYSRLGQSVTLSFSETELDHFSERLARIPKDIHQTLFSAPEQSTCDQCTYYPYDKNCPSTPIR